MCAVAHIQLTVLAVGCTQPCWTPWRALCPHQPIVVAVATVAVAIAATMFFAPAYSPQYLLGVLPLRQRAVVPQTREAWWANTCSVDKPERPCSEAGASLRNGFRSEKPSNGVINPAAQSVVWTNQQLGQPQGHRPCSGSGVSSTPQRRQGHPWNPKRRFACDTEGPRPRGTA